MGKDLMFQTLTPSSSLVLLKAEKFSEQDVVIVEASGKYSTFDQGMKPTQFFINLKFNRS